MAWIYILCFSVLTSRVLLGPLYFALPPALLFRQYLMLLHLSPCSPLDKTELHTHCLAFGSLEQFSCTQPLSGHDYVMMGHSKPKCVDACWGPRAPPPSVIHASPRTSCWFSKTSGKKQFPKLYSPWIVFHSFCWPCWQWGKLWWWVASEI